MRQEGCTPSEVGWGLGLAGHRAEKASRGDREERQGVPRKLAFFTVTCFLAKC